MSGDRFVDDERTGKQCDDGTPLGGRNGSSVTGGNATSGIGGTPQGAFAVSGTEMKTRSPGCWPAWAPGSAPCAVIAESR
jgi:hypothetical protein